MSSPPAIPNERLWAYLRYVEYNFAFAGLKDRQVMCDELISLALAAGEGLTELLGSVTPHLHSAIVQAATDECDQH